MATAVHATAGAFTSRQAQVVRLIAAGATRKGIAAALGIAERTAKGHCDALRYKLRVRHSREVPAAYYEATGDNPFEATL